MANKPFQGPFGESKVNLTNCLKKSGIISPGLINATRIVFILLIAVLPACSDTVELTPSDLELYSSWKIADKVRIAYRSKNADSLLKMVSPALSQKWDLQKKLESIFLGMARTGLHLEMDSGIWDPDTGTVIYKAHWTFVGMITEGSPKLFKTGECRLWISLPENGKASSIQKIIGDNFFLISLPKKRVVGGGGM